MLRSYVSLAALGASTLLAPALVHAQNSWPMFHVILPMQRQLPCGEIVHDQGTGRDESFAMTFDARGHVLTRTSMAAGSNVTRTTTYHYDAQGRPTAEEHRDADETIRVTYSLDANGRPVTRDMVGTRVHVLMRMAWDARGRLTRVEYDNGADGSIDMTESFGYEHDRLTTFEERMGERVQYSERYFYDARGRIIRMERDMLNNGTVDLRRMYVYDSRGRLVREDNDRRADGTVDDSREYRYECR